MTQIAPHPIPVTPPGTPQSMAIIATGNASRYLQQLAKHWSHKFPVDFDADNAHIALPLGDADLAAGDMALTVTCSEREPGSLPRLQQVVADHLNRFAFREGELEFFWRGV